MSFRNIRLKNANEIVVQFRSFSGSGFIVERNNCRSANALARVMPAKGHSLRLFRCHNLGVYYEKTAVRNLGKIGSPYKSMNILLAVHRRNIKVGCFHVIIFRENLQEYVCYRVFKRHARC